MADELTTAIAGMKRDMEKSTTMKAAESTLRIGVTTIARPWTGQVSGTIGRRAAMMIDGARNTATSGTTIGAGSAHTARTARTASAGIGDDGKKTTRSSSTATAE